MIELSPSAIQEIKRMQLACQQTDSFLRLTVKSGGCKDLYYCFELWQEDPSENDTVYTHEGVKVMVDRQSDRYLQNVRIDYAEDLLGGGFRFQNPQAIAVCRCSLSFSYDSEVEN